MACKCNEAKSLSTATPRADGAQQLANQNRAGSLERQVARSGVVAAALPSSDAFLSEIVLTANGCAKVCETDLARAVLALAAYGPIIRAIQNQWSGADVGAFARALICLGCELCPVHPPAAQPPPPPQQPQLPPPPSIEPPEARQVCQEPRPSNNGSGAAQPRYVSAEQQRQRVAHATALTRSAILGTPMQRTRLSGQALGMTRIDAQQMQMTRTGGAAVDYPIENSRPRYGQ